LAWRRMIQCRSSSLKRATSTTNRTPSKCLYIQTKGGVPPGESWGDSWS
jgi:hypothetical protein